MGRSDTSGHVAILMGVYNGAHALKPQLASFADQDHDDWQLIASDDGSTDTSRQILADFALEQRSHGRSVAIVDGIQQGFACNFLTLLANLPDQADWIATSDQDDQWHRDRLSRGIETLQDLPADVPALYCSRTWITDSEFNPRGLSKNFPKPPGFYNALVQNIASGNTTLLNRAAANIVRAAARDAVTVPGLIAHDWWMYQVISGVGGTVIWDPKPTLNYAQHEGNLIGANDTWRARVHRLTQVFRGTFARWNTANIAALRQISDQLTPENRTLMEEFARLRQKPMIARVRAFSKLGIRRQSWPAQMVMYLALIIGKF